MVRPASEGLSENTIRLVALRPAGQKRKPLGLPAIPAIAAYTIGKGAGGACIGAASSSLPEKPMARLKPIKEPATEKTREIYAKLTAAFNGVPNVMATFANHDKIFAGIWELVCAIFVESTLDPRLRELVYLKTSMANHCHY